MMRIIRPSAIVLVSNIGIVMLAVAANQWAYGWDPMTMLHMSYWVIGNIVGYFIHKLLVPNQRERYLRERVEVVVRDMMTELKKKAPQDFVSGGRGWQCPHMSRLEELITQLNVEKRKP